MWAGVVGDDKATHFRRPQTVLLLAQGGHQEMNCLVLLQAGEKERYVRLGTCRLWCESFRIGEDGDMLRIVVRASWTGRYYYLECRCESIILV